MRQAPRLDRNPTGTASKRSEAPNPQFPALQDRQTVHEVTTRFLPKKSGLQTWLVG